MKLIVFAIAFLVVIWIIKRTLTKIEGFSYQDCMSQGYTKSFCVSQPFPSMCRCPNGMIGKRIPGFEGACICGYNDIYTPPVYPVPII